MSVSHLQLVDTDTGELVEGGCPECQLHEADLVLVENDLRRARREIKRLKADRDAAAKLHPRLDEIKAVFALWCEACGHPRSKLDTDRTFLIADALDKYDRPTCELAIRGAAHDPFTTQRKNGTVKRHDGLALIFKSADKCEEFCCRAPANYRHHYAALKAAEETAQ